MCDLKFVTFSRLFSRAISRTFFLQLLIGELQKLIAMGEEVYALKVWGLYVKLLGKVRFMQGCDSLLPFMEIESINIPPC